ncbi:MAG: nucleotidyltransferase family protein [Prevotellaceae bacterium]|jgi:hypothetical protein|nr:nucleotidyltransferase family protein [Prevotellaceae bacterium]
MKNNMENSNIDFVKNTLLINQFYKILALMENDCQIVPLKGMSLLLSLYQNDISQRNVGDIDILISENKVEAVSDILQKKMGYVFKDKNYKNGIKVRQKFDMINPNQKFCDLDIHLGLLNKKSFRTSVDGDFTDFALSRLRKIEHNNTVFFLLSPIDEWLYLAQHYCFHLFSNEKWLKDLYLLQKKFSVEEKNELIYIAKKHHFERVVTAVAIHLRNTYAQDDIIIPKLVTKKYRIFDLILSNTTKKYAYNFSNRIIALYWQFIFIDNAKARFKSFLQLVFPSPIVLSDIYKCKLKLSCIFYLLHIILLFIQSILFFPFLWFKLKFSTPYISHD